MLQIDFLSSAVNYRRQFGGGKNELIAKAVGIKSSQKIAVFDATAGLGRDAFILATLGCDVLMCERSPVVYELLRDALARAGEFEWFQKLSLKLIHADATAYLSTMDHRPDVIYIDPMYPPKNKSALPKKEMILLREIVGDDLDSVKLLAVALRVAKKRVVVKRARLAPTISDQKPSFVYEGKSSRFDVYLT
jgi:16S rRNA (guanine1516-N2)-methyltransferase